MQYHLDINMFHFEWWFTDYRGLADNQLRVIGEKLDYNIQLQKAFQHFGQGVLFDDSIDEESHLPRRPYDDKVHMMDALHFWISPGGMYFADLPLL